MDKNIFTLTNAAPLQWLDLFLCEHAYYDSHKICSPFRLQTATTPLSNSINWIRHSSNRIFDAEVQMLSGLYNVPFSYALNTDALRSSAIMPIILHSVAPSATYTSDRHKHIYGSFHLRVCQKVNALFNRL